MRLRYIYGETNRFFHVIKLFLFNQTQFGATRKIREINTKNLLLSFTRTNNFSKYIPYNPYNTMLLNNKFRLLQLI